MATSTEAAADVAAEVVLPEQLAATSVVRQVAIDTLKVDRSYQRDVSMRMVDEIVGKWDEVASELLLVSDRGEREDGTGGLYLVNGQHRTTAAKKMGLKKVWARIINLTEHPDPAKVEAGLRLMTNVRLGDRPTERFKAQLRSGNEESKAIVKILSEFDTEINEVPVQDEGINSVSGVETLYRVDDGGLLREVLEVIRKAYGKVGGRYATLNIMKGVAWFIVKHADDTDRDRLIAQLEVTGPAQLDRRARASQSVMGGTLWLNYYRTIVELYNDNLHQKNKLKWATRGSGSFTSNARERDRSESRERPS